MFNTSIQPLCICCDSVRVDVPACGRNCQLAGRDCRPFPHPLDIIVDHLVDDDAPVVVLAAPAIRSVSRLLTSGK